MNLHSIDLFLFECVNYDFQSYQSHVKDASILTKLQSVIWNATSEVKQPFFKAKY